MKKPTLALGLLFALALPVASADQPASPFIYDEVAEAPSNAQDREIAALFDEWNKALQTGDSAKVAALYSGNAVLQPTVSNRVRTTNAEIQDYFDHFLPLKPVGEINYREIRRLGPDVALDSGVYTFHLTPADGPAQSVQARYTFLYSRAGGEWRILNHHSSAMPEVLPAQAQAAR
ncbi:SgcJ/EcaC family oxidoreductase [Pseudomonas sp. Marseille-QA0892]